MDRISKAPLISVLIPAYNHAKYIGDAIRSIAEQTYANIELLAIDDGSTDQTYEKIKGLQQLYNDRFVSFNLKRQDNAGIIRTLNTLLRDASGDYVYLMASDDMAKPHALQLQLDFLINNPEYGLVVGNNEIIDSEGRVAFWNKKQDLVYKKSKAKYCTFGDALKCKKRGALFGAYLDLYAGNHIPNGYLVRRSIFDKTGFYITDAPLEDWYIHLQIAKYSKLKYLDQVLFSYRWHGGNTVRQKERMQKITHSTFEYENKLLASLPEDQLSQDMKDCLKYGKNRRKLVIIPRYFELRSFRKANKKGHFLRLWKSDIVF